MRPVNEIIAELEQRDLLDLAKSHASAGKIPVEQLFATTRAREVSRPRQAFFSALHEEHDFTASRIGELVGLERTTVMMAIKAHRARVAKAEERGSAFDDRIAALEERCDRQEREIDLLKSVVHSMQKGAAA